MTSALSLKVIGRRLGARVRPAPCGTRRIALPTLSCTVAGIMEVHAACCSLPGNVSMQALLSIPTNAVLLMLVRIA